MMPPETERGKQLFMENEALRVKLQRIRGVVSRECDICPYADIGCDKECKLLAVRGLILEKQSCGNG